ncbi:TPA: hypothetical protein HA318_03815 [Candidatus Micrarchaeota archaeon]|nr:MAG: hypothetical protein AUJ65_04855 [Candidatus Micrarchaeota archaeon CG1_02_51_15]HII39098.1 hypothetical protein [Candidatus Micrarchaeota archaeon]
MASERKRFAVHSLDGASGRVELGEDDVVLCAGGKPVGIKKAYVAGVNKVEDLALGKVGVAFTYYDLFGNKECVSLAMAESDYRALKKMLGK